MPATPSGADQLFSSLESQGEAERFTTLETMVKERMSESVWLDFKGAGQIKSVGKSGTKEEAADDKWLREEFSKYVSAFGNSGGGMVVWGIATEKDTKTFRDVAQSFSFVREPFKFAARLDQFLITTAYPLVLGVKNLPIAAPGRLDGCVVTYAPSSAHIPHRAEEAGEKYYVRADDDCATMPHELLRHCFMPRFYPNLTFTLKPRGFDTIPQPQNPSDHSNVVANMDLYVTNDGNGTAKDVFLSLPDWKNLTRNNAADAWQLTGQTVLGYYCKKNIHPTQTLLVASLGMRSKAHLIVASPTSNRNVPTFEPFDATINTYAENVPVQINRIRVTEQFFSDTACTSLVSERVE